MTATKTAKTAKAYALVAVTDDESVCSCCGKLDLKRVMWLVSLDEEGEREGEVFSVGTTCGKKLLQVTQSKVNTMVKNFSHRKWQKQQELMESHPLSQKIHDLQDRLNGLGKMEYEERMNHPLMVEIDESRKVLKEWVESQEILIPV